MSLVYTVKMVRQACISCGVAFAMDEDVDARFREDHRMFYCPNGHRQFYSGKSEVDKERERRIRAEARAARYEDKAEVAERRRRAEKAAKTRILNRIHAGVCVHCKRTFPNLAAHMETKHPEVTS